MTSIITLNSSDALEPTSRTNINTNFTALNAGKAEVVGQVFTGAISATNLSGTNTGDQTLNSLLPSQSGANGKVLTSDGTNTSFQNVASAATGTVTSASVVSANGFAGTVATATSTPAITVTTTVTGVLKGNGTAISAATAGTDYSVPAGAETLSNKTIVKPVINATNPTAQTYTPSAAGTSTLDLSLSNQHYVTFPAGNITLALSNDTNNQIFIVSLLQDATGSRTVTWFSGISWAGGSVPNLTTTAAKKDVFGFIRTGSGAYMGFVVGLNV